MLFRKDWWSASEVRSYRTLALRRIARAMRLKGWAQGTTGQAGILRDARRNARLRMRSVRTYPKLIGFMVSIHQGLQSPRKAGARGGRDGIPVRQRGQDCARWAESPLSGPAFPERDEC